MFAYTFPSQVLGATLQKHPLTLIPVREVHWRMGNFGGISSAGRRRVDQGNDPILAHAALFAAQTEQTKAN